jgi:hypothetical protein
MEKTSDRSFNEVKICGELTTVYTEDDGNERAMTIWNQ